MKKKLLYLTSIVLFSVTSINAQTKIWNLGGEVAPWTVAGSPFTTAQVLDNLGLQIQSGSGTANFGTINQSIKTFATTQTASYTSANRFQINGGGTPALSVPGDGKFLATPSQRSLYFNAAGTVSIEVCFIGGGSGNRTLWITDGTKELGHLTATDSTTPLVLTTTAAAVNGNVFIYGDAALNLYRVSVIGPLGTTQLLTLGTNDFQQESSVVVYANDGKINLSNVTSATKVSVYSVLGSLVKSIETSEDASVEIAPGVYVVKAQSAEGTKTAKVIVQ